MPKVALRTRTRPPPAMGASAAMRATPVSAVPDSSTTTPDASTTVTWESLALLVKACRTGRSDWRGTREASPATARASSSAGGMAKSEARAVKRSMTMTANMAERISVVAASGMNTCKRNERPVRRAWRRRAESPPSPSRKRMASASSSSCLSIVAQTVAYAAHRLQHARVAARLLDLPAQRFHVHVDRSIADGDIASPDRLEQLAALEDAAGAAEKDHQEVELGPRERELILGRESLARARVGGERSHLQRSLLGGALPRCAPQHRTDARRHLARRERLEHVVVGAHLQSDDAVGLLVAAGAHDDRDVARPSERAHKV